MISSFKTPISPHSLSICSGRKLHSWADPEEGGGGRGSGPPLKNHKNIVNLSNTGPDPLKNKNNKATKPATAKRQLNDDGPFIVISGSSIPSSTKKKKKKSYHFLTPSDKTFWIRACSLNRTKS